VLPDPTINGLPDIRDAFYALAEKKSWPVSVRPRTASPTNLGIEAVHNHQLDGVVARKVTGFELSDKFGPLQAYFHVRPSIEFLLPQHHYVLVKLVQPVSLRLVALLATKDKARFGLPCLLSRPEPICFTRFAQTKSIVMPSSTAKGKGTWSKLMVTHGLSNPKRSCSRRSSSRPASPALSACSTLKARSRLSIVVDLGAKPAQIIQLCFDGRNIFVSNEISFFFFFSSK
jgi:hypothetical protein